MNKNKRSSSCDLKKPKIKTVSVGLNTIAIKKKKQLLPLKYRTDKWIYNITLNINELLYDCSYNNYTEIPLLKKNIGLRSS